MLLSWVFYGESRGVGRYVRERRDEREECALLFVKEYAERNGGLNDRWWVCCKITYTHTKEESSVESLQTVRRIISARSSSQRRKASCSYSATRKLLHIMRTTTPAQSRNCPFRGELS